MSSFIWISLGWVLFWAVFSHPRCTYSSEAILVIIYGSFVFFQRHGNELHNQLRGEQPVTSVRLEPLVN